MDFLADAYLWTKSFHIIAIITWMAGLLYLPRLFVYHCETQPGSSEWDRFGVMERRLLRLIMNPAMIATYVLGIGLALTPGLVDWGSGWIYAKLLLVGGLTVVHHVYAKWRKAFSAGNNRHPARVYRIANEVPTILMIGIVILVVVKPF